MTNPKVSIIVPIYNVEKYLNQCIETIVRQTYKNIEIVLVDDGSPDNCPNIIDEWSLKDSRIKVVHKRNGGLMNAWKDGVLISSGELISFVDSDDYVEYTFIETLVNTLIKNDADISVCDYCDVNEGERTLRRQLKDRAVFKKSDEYNCIELLKSSGDCEHWFAHCRWNKLYKREIVEKCLPYLNGSITMGEDLNLIFCALAEAQIVAYEPQALYCYRILSKSMSHKICNNWGSYKLLLQALWAYITTNNLTGVYQELYRQYAWNFFIQTALHYIQNKDKNGFKLFIKEEFLQNVIWEQKSERKKYWLYKLLYKFRMYKILYFLIGRFK